MVTMQSAELTVCFHLDAADGLLRLHHADVLGRGLIGQQLGGAQVVGCEDDPVDQVLRVTRAWDWRGGGRFSLGI